MGRQGYTSGSGGAADSMQEGCALVHASSSALAASAAAAAAWARCVAVSGLASMVGLAATCTCSRKCLEESCEMPSPAPKTMSHAVDARVDKNAHIHISIRLHGPRAAVWAGAGAAAGRGALHAELCPGSALSVQCPLQAALQRGHSGLRIPLIQVGPAFQLPQLQAQLCTRIMIMASGHGSPCLAEYAARIVR